MSDMSTPRADGFAMPAEYSRHAGTVMIWPERPGSWIYGGGEARAAFADVIRAITRSERVWLAVSPASRPSAEELLAPLIASGGVTLLDAVTDDAWARDVGPTCVVRGGEVRGVDWRFNAWGGEVDGLYASWDKDDAFARVVCDALGLRRYDARPFVCEGGSVHSDGDGTLMVTSECLLSAGRNPALTQAEIESRLLEYLGGDAVLWLPYGIYGDETNGHVDNVCAFTSPGEVVLAWTDDPSDPNYARLREDRAYLESVRDARGRRLRVRLLPLPARPVCITEREAAGFVPEPGEDERVPGERLAASYVNFYVTNGGVVMPVFGDENDDVAAGVLADAFPDREILRVTARAIIVGGGNVHCITQQIPEGKE